MKGSFVFLLFVKQLPNTEHKQQDTECAAQEVGRDGRSEKGGQWGDDTAGQGTPENGAPDNPVIACVGDQRGRRTAEKIKQIDTGCGQLLHVLYNGQPQDKQRAAADTETGQNTGDRAGKDSAYHSSTERIPPQMSSSPNNLRRSDADIRGKIKPERKPPRKPPMRYGAASERETVPRCR